MDALKGAALIIAFLGFIAVFATWAMLWENVWRVSVEAFVVQSMRLDSIALALRLAFAHHGCGGGRRGVA